MMLNGVLVLLTHEQGGAANMLFYHLKPFLWKIRNFEVWARSVGSEEHDGIVIGLHSIVLTRWNTPSTQEVDQLIPSHFLDQLQPIIYWWQLTKDPIGKKIVLYLRQSGHEYHKGWKQIVQFFPHQKITKSSSHNYRLIWQHLTGKIDWILCTTIMIALIKLTLTVRNEHCISNFLSFPLFPVKMLLIVMVWCEPLMWPVVHQ